jgi:AcrR family transcriptional regulator
MKKPQAPITPSREAPLVRGRPRDAGRDTAIIDATMCVLTELGYEQMSVEAVAARAEVAKTTIYRRYPSKAALVMAAVERRAAAIPPTVKSGDLRERLLVVVTWLAGEISGQQAGLLGALFSAMRTDPDLAAEMRLILRRDEDAMAKALFGRPAERSEQLEPNASELFAEVAPAVILHRLAVGQSCGNRFLEHLVDDILLPLVQRRPATERLSPAAGKTTEHANGVLGN